MKGWKTIAFNVLTGALLLLENMGVGLGLSNEILAAVLTVGNLILRFLTTTPVGQSS